MTSKRMRGPKVQLKNIWEQRRRSSFPIRYNWDKSVQSYELIVFVVFRDSAMAWYPKKSDDEVASIDSEDRYTLTNF